MATTHPVAVESYTYTLDRGEFTPGVRGTRDQPAEQPFYEVFMQVSGQFPAVDFTDAMEFNPDVTVKEMVEELARQVYEGDLKELDDDSYTWFGPNNFNFYFAGNLVHFSCEYDGYETVPF